MYGSLFFDHPFLEKGFWSLTSLFERGQMNMGDNLWKIREKYINSSPIFNADLVTTPILLMNNKLDAVIPFNQGVEFFNGLRRLRKKVWLLQYEGERHALSKEASKFDFTMRLEQFFGHYLKNEQMPEWMKEK
jgi:dipeptidyl aminopeptidase/acylaminoacyl peptidase